MSEPLAAAPRPGRKRHLDNTIPAAQRPKMITADPPEDPEWQVFREKIDKMIETGYPKNWQAAETMNANILKQNTLSPLQEGDKAPLIEGLSLEVTNNSVRDMDKQELVPFSLKAMLDQGYTVIINFFWGNFCPYCSEFINRMHAKIGNNETVKFVAISPYPSYKLATMTKNFSNLKGLILVSDHDGEMMKAFGVAHQLTPEYVQALEEEGCVEGGICDLYDTKENVPTLPISSGFVVDATGTCRYSEYFVNNHKKPSVNAIASVVGMIEQFYADSPRSGV